MTKLQSQSKYQLRLQFANRRQHPSLWARHEAQIDNYLFKPLKGLFWELFYWQIKYRLIYELPTASEYFSNKSVVIG